MGCQFNPVLLGVFIGTGIVLGVLLKISLPENDNGNTPSPTTPGPTPIPPTPIPPEPTPYTEASYKYVTLVKLKTYEDFNRFSVSLSDDGDVLAIGGPGYVLISKYNDEKWQKWSDGKNNFTSSLPDDMLENELRFGETVALSGDGNVLAVSSFFSSDGGKGIVQTFQYNGTDWIPKYPKEENYINLTKENPEGSISLSVDEDGNTLAAGVSNPWNDNNYNGYVRLYNVTDKKYISWKNITGTEGDACGNSISMNNDGYTIAIGCNRAREDGENSGKVMIWRYNQDWNKEETIEGDEKGDYSGTSVSLNNEGDRVAIGSPGHDENDIDDAGECRAYERNGDEWEKIGESIIGEKPNYKLGGNVAISGDGARLASTSAFNTFKVYEYKSGDWLDFWEFKNLESGTFEDLKMNEKGNVIATSISNFDDPDTNEKVAKVFVYREEQGEKEDEL